MLAAEGECIEVMNMRVKDGAFVPLPRPRQAAVLECSYSRIFWHEMARHYLCLTDDSTATLHFYDKEWNRVKDASGQPLLHGGLKGVLGVEFQGYVACCITASGIEYLLYNDGGYLFLGQRPPMPVLDVTVKPKVARIVTAESFKASATDDFESTWRYNAKGFFDEAISSLTTQGYYIDRAMFRLALRCYDGSYMAISPAIYVSDDGRINDVRRDSLNLLAVPVSSSDTSAYDVQVMGFRPQFVLKDLDLGAWKNIVVGIDLFTTGSIMGKKAERLKWRKRADGASGIELIEYEAYVPKEHDELADEISNASHYYRIAEYDTAGKLLHSLDDVSQSSLVLQQSLENGSSSCTSVVPACTYMFNGRLHAGGLKEYFSKGYGVQFIKGLSGSTRAVSQVYVMTRISTLGGTSSVVRRYPSAELMFSNGRYELPPLLSYPDSRAFEMQICIDTGTQCLLKSFSLVPHRFLNQAQYLNRWVLGYKVSVKASLSGGAALCTLYDDEAVAMFKVPGTHELTYSKASGEWMYQGAAFTGHDTVGVRLVTGASGLADGDRITFTIAMCDDESSFKDIRNIAVDISWSVAEEWGGFTEANPYELRQNVLKVSAAGNPFVFPVQCTYTPSQGSIVALASNTVALSQGQFGQHPLYVFCSDGIWVMAVDASGSVAYLASHPLSREVCVSRNTVCGIDGGVVFMGQQGLMLLAGGKMKKLSAAMEGSTALSQQALADTVVRKISSMMGLDGAVAADDFRSFMDGAVVSYLPAHKEIVVANEEYAYCCIYSLLHNTWGHMSLRVRDFIGCYPSPMMLAGADGKSVVLEMDSAQSGDNTVLLVSRPQLWGTELPKRVLHLMLHAYAKPPAGKEEWLPSLACYMFGSNDGANFRLIAGRESIKETNDLKFPYFPTQAYSCYLFVICGKMSAGSMITGIELEIGKAWSNRLR